MTVLRQCLGVFLLLLPFTILGYIIYREDGWMAVLFVYGTMVAILSLGILGMWLLVGHG